MNGMPKLTIRAGRVMAVANQEAQRFNHEYIGTEHILLAIACTEACTAFHILTDMGVEQKSITDMVNAVLKSGPDMVTMGTLPLTPRVEKAIEKACQEAKAMNLRQVGSEHILMGLLQDGQAVATVILTRYGVTYKSVCLAVHAVETKIPGIDVTVSLQYKATYKNNHLCRVVIPFVVEGDADWQWFAYFSQEVIRHEETHKVKLYVVTSSDGIQLAIPLSIQITSDMVLDIEKRCVEVAKKVNSAFTKQNATALVEKEREAKIQVTIEELRQLG